MSRTGAMLETSFAAHPIPATMRAAVYRGKGRVVVEDVPVPGSRRASPDTSLPLRDLRHGHQEDRARFCRGSANFWA